MNLFDLGAEPFDAAVCIYTFCKVCNLVADNALYGVLIDVGALGHGDECFAAVVRMMPRVKCKTVDDDLELTGIQKAGLLFTRLTMKQKPNGLTKSNSKAGAVEKSAALSF